MAKWVFTILALILLLFNAAPALAHKMSVFAAAEGKTIAGQAYFRDGAPVRNAQVTVFDAAGRTLGQSKTDEAGKFSFQPRARCDHRFVVDAGDGHAAEFTVPGEELPSSLPGFGAAATPPMAKADAAPRTPPKSGPDAGKVVDPRTPEESLRGELEAIRQQIVALRADLAARDEKARWHDVLGGIGYILGFSGVAFYFAGLRRKSGAHAGAPTP
jgi:nickel transport protein